MARLITRKQDGSLIIDSKYICMGLVKSGYMQSFGTWQRYKRESLNTSTVVPYSQFDPVHGFTVKATAPLVFVAGRSVFHRSESVGDTTTFYYGGASTGTRYFVFDLMSERVRGPKLKLRNSQGVVTLDSLQIPLNVVGTVTPPLPQYSNSNLQGFGLPYSGGSTSFTGRGNFVTAFCTWSTNPNLGTDLAACIPWNRGANHTQDFNYGGAFGSIEGVYGNGSLISFIFMTEPGGNYNSFAKAPFPQNLVIGLPAFMHIPVDRRPEASFIDVTNLPFPYDIT